MKTIQFFTTEYLDECKKIDILEILKFLEDFRILFGEENLNSIQNKDKKFDEEFIKEFNKK